MTRHEAREIAMHLVFSLNYHEGAPEALLDSRLSREAFAALAEDAPLYGGGPDPVQEDYIRAVVRGVFSHLAELDHYIEKYAVGWEFGRLSQVAAAILRLAMYEILYRDDIPAGVAINEAVELSKVYETPETAAFINGILGTCVRQELPQ